MVKTKQNVSANEKKVAVTDVCKSISDNLEERISHWANVRDEIKRRKQKVVDLQTLRDKISDTGANRSKRADLRAQIDDEWCRISEIMCDDDEIEFIGCIAKVSKESITKAATETEFVEPQHHQEVKVISAMGPMRTRNKKKQLNNTKVATVTATSISAFVSEEDSEGESLNECKRLAQMMHEIPIDQADFEYCPSCPGKIILEFIEKPPSMCCPRCGLCRDTIDISSSAVHDKETPVHIPFTYKPKQHFESWINRVTGRTRPPIPKYVMDAIYLELGNMRVEDLDNVTWDMVDRILRKLAKKVGKWFNEYYQHVYQITNIIHGTPILDLSVSQKQDLLDMFDVIHESWERNKVCHVFSHNLFTLSL